MSPDRKRAERIAKRYYRLVKEGHARSAATYLLAVAEERR